MFLLLYRPSASVQNFHAGNRSETAHGFRKISTLFALGVKSAFLPWEQGPVNIPATAAIDNERVKASEPTDQSDYH
jgi:hypothetical protein